MNIQEIFDKIIKLDEELAIYKAKDSKKVDELYNNNLDVREARLQFNKFYKLFELNHEICWFLDQEVLKYHGPINSRQLGRNKLLVKYATYKLELIESLVKACRDLIV